MMHTDHAGSRMGMWLFLFTEILLFGGLFVLYAAYLNRYPQAFIQAGQELDLVLGTINTVLLLISSLCVAAAITAIRRQQKRLALITVGTTVFLGAVFLINKVVEWGHKFDQGIYPNSPTLAEGDPGRTLFFGLYYVVTGLHGLHIIIGMVLLTICWRLILINRINHHRFVVLENCGLYWHLVDLIWIFVFPLFYLIV